MDSTVTELPAEELAAKVRLSPRTALIAIGVAVGGIVAYTVAKSLAKSENEETE